MALLWLVFALAQTANPRQRAAYRGFSLYSTRFYQATKNGRLSRTCLFTKKRNLLSYVELFQNVSRR